MSDNPRITLYMSGHDAMRQVLKEEKKELNGAYLANLFWNEVCGKILMLQNIIMCMYQGELSLKEAMLQIIEYIMFSGIEKRMFFNAIPNIAKDACGNSVWLTEGNKYFFVDLEEILKNLSTILDDHFKETIEGNEFLSELVSEGWEIEFEENGDISEDYPDEDRDAIMDYMWITDQKTKICKMIESGGTKPADIINFITINWRWFYNEQEVYKAIEFCIKNASEVADSPFLRKRLRDFAKFTSLIQEYNKHMERVTEAGKSKWNDGWLEYFEE